MEKELLEQSILADSDFKTEYPNLNDPNFNTKIASKIEFGIFKYKGEIKDLEEYSNELSNAPFELSPHQHFVKNFLSPSTPYNSILLFHGLGTGKTCSAIGIAEEERDFIKSINSNKKIIIVATPNVQENFSLQLFNENDLKDEDGLWKCSSCVGNKLIKEANPTDIKNIPKNVIKAQIKGIISKYYQIMGYEQFSSKIEEIATRGGEDKQKTIKNIQHYFNGRLIIFDEIHHATEDKEKKSISNNLMLLVNDRRKLP
jgi:superfamily II DNA or RNA helicase